MSVQGLLYAPIILLTVYEKINMKRFIVTHNDDHEILFYADILYCWLCICYSINTVLPHVRQ